MIIENTEITKYAFSGHDSFQCRQLWLNYVQEGKNFNDDAVVQLGVGKNMVSSIRFWLKAFNIINNKEIPTEVGKRLFDDENGYDPFLEDEASLWLLHYQLVKNGLASIYSIIFNIIRYRSHSKRFSLFEGTDLDIQTALIEAGNKISEVADIRTLLNNYLGVPLSGRAFRSSFFALRDKRISTAIPNASSC